MIHVVIEIYVKKEVGIPSGYNLFSFEIEGELRDEFSSIALKQFGTFYLLFFDLCSLTALISICVWTNICCFTLNVI